MEPIRVPLQRLVLESGMVMGDSFGCSFRTAHQVVYSPLGHRAERCVTSASGLASVADPGDFSSTLNATPMTGHYKESFIS